jgi:hypothetical protein
MIVGTCATPPEVGSAGAFGSDPKSETQKRAEGAPAAAREPTPSSIPMGGNKSVTRFFVTSKGLGKGGNLGGLAGADAHCQALAQAGVRT